jgi:nucleoside permease NupC
MPDHNQTFHDLVNGLSQGGEAWVPNGVHLALTVAAIVLVFVAPALVGLVHGLLRGGDETNVYQNENSFYEKREG